MTRLEIANRRLRNQRITAATLKSVYDEYISGYKDHSAVAHKTHGATLEALGNALSYIIVVDSQIVGAWKRTLRKTAVVIQTNLFTRLTRAEERAVAAAANRYGEFLGPPVVLSKAPVRARQFTDEGEREALMLESLL